MIQYYVRKTEIQDFPRFRHRGILMDTARHYINKDVILEILVSFVFYLRNDYIIGNVIGWIDVAVYCSFKVNWLSLNVVGVSFGRLTLLCMTVM